MFAAVMVINAVYDKMDFVRIIILSTMFFFMKFCLKKIIEVPK